MKSFNIHRFYATFKWMELYNYKALVRFFSILAPILFVLAMLTTGGFWRIPSDIATSYEDDLYRLPAMLWSAWFIVFIIWASYITIDMKNTQARINTLMLPASNLEKFVVRWIHITILPCVVDGTSLHSIWCNGGVDAEVGCLRTVGHDRRTAATRQVNFIDDVLVTGREEHGSKSQH